MSTRRERGESLGMRRGRDSGRRKLYEEENGDVLNQKTVRSTHRFLV